MALRRDVDDLLSSLATRTRDVPPMISWQMSTTDVRIREQDQCPAGATAAPPRLPPAAAVLRGFVRALADQTSGHRTSPGSLVLDALLVAVVVSKVGSAYCVATP